MSGSLEIRQFLMRYEGSETPTAPGQTPGVPTQRTGSQDASRISDEQLRRAQLAVAHGSTDRRDCAELLDMLGLIPDGDGIPPAQR